MKFEKLCGRWYSYKTINEKPPYKYTSSTPYIDIDAFKPMQTTLDLDHHR